MLVLYVACSSSEDDRPATAHDASGGSAGSSGGSVSSGTAGNAQAGTSGAGATQSSGGAAGSTGGSAGSSAAAGGSAGDAGSASVDASGDGPPPFIPDAALPPIDGASPIEPLPGGNWARVKSPQQQMHFTEQLPFRLLADAIGIEEWNCPPGHPPYVCPDEHVDFLINGSVAGTVQMNDQSYNHWELRLPGGLLEGSYALTVRLTPHNSAGTGGTLVDGLVPVYIHVDPLPTHAKTVTLTSDLVLSGSTDLDWADTTVIGGGHRVTAAGGYSGKIIIEDSFVSGLAGFDDQVGIDVTTTGAVSIHDSIFEATAPLHLTVNGSAPISINGNEFRSTNYVTYVASNPGASPILDISGNTSGQKTMQGNNIGGGIVTLSTTSAPDWQVGGLSDDLSNILMGPRCVIVLSESHATVQGNYMHHDYKGGWSQGFNLMFGSGGSALAEHNVIREGSWPLQSVAGEFRYNLMLDSGHDFIRSAKDGASLHHNVMVHTSGPDGSFNGAFLMYEDEKDIEFYSNTLDGGGATGHFGAPVLALQGSVMVSTVRNNLVTGFSNSPSAGNAFVAGTGVHVTAADYNGFFNPLATDVVPYASGIVASTPGTHDVKADPKLLGPVPESPYAIDEGAVWLRAIGVSQVLAHYRSLYTPGTGSPMLDAGDPSDGAGTDIGAVGSGTEDPKDLFGRVMTPTQ